MNVSALPASPDQDGDLVSVPDIPVALENRGQSRLRGAQPLELVEDQSERLIASLAIEEAERLSPVGE